MISLVSTLASLLTSSEFRNIIPLWHGKETKRDHFQVEGTIIGWEFYLKTQEGFVLSSSNNKLATKADIDFRELSIGDRITAEARKDNLKKTNREICYSTQYFFFNFRFRMLKTSSEA